MEKLIRTIIITLIIALMAGVVSAQLVDQADAGSVPAQQEIYGVEPAVSSFSLIDFSRVKWSHSYSVSYFSGGSYSGSMGCYNSSIFYELSPKLSLTLNIGISHNAGSLWGDGNNDASILPGFRLDYHPSEKFRMTLMVQKIDASYLPYSGYYYYRPGLFSPY